MLLLTRRIGEKLCIGEAGNMEITVVGIKGSQVRLGIEAPRDVPVHRSEIFDKINAEKLADQKLSEPSSLV